MDTVNPLVAWRDDGHDWDFILEIKDVNGVVYTQGKMLQSGMVADYLWEKPVSGKWKVVSRLIHKDLYKSLS